MAGLFCSSETAPTCIVSGGHPGLPLDAPQEIRRGGDPAEDGAHVPFGDNARRNGGVAEDDAEALLGFENSETVVTHRKMPRIGEPGRGFEEPAV